MCIAIIKSANIALPSYQTLENCFLSNPDGAGYAYSNGKYFIIKKGFKTFESLKASLEALEVARGPDFLKKAPMFLHFRIGTHGSTDDPKHTHPFPLTNDIARLEALETKASRIVMHNGILSSYGVSHYASTKDKSSALSDTMDFIATFLYPLQKAIGDSLIVDNKYAQSLVTKEVTGSRVVIMEPDGRSIRWGDWVKDEGCIFSNTGYKYVAPKPVTSWYSRKSDIDYSYDDDRYENYWTTYKKPEATTVTVPAKPAPIVPATTDDLDLYKVFGRVPTFLEAKKHLKGLGIFQARIKGYSYGARQQYCHVNLADNPFVDYAKRKIYLYDDDFGLLEFEAYYHSLDLVGVARELKEADA